MKPINAYLFLTLIAATFTHTMNVKVKTKTLKRFEAQNSESKIIRYEGIVSLYAKKYYVTIEKEMVITGNSIFNKATWKGFRCFNCQNEQGDWHTIHDELPFDTTILLFNILSGVQMTRQWKVENPNTK